MTGNISQNEFKEAIENSSEDPFSLWIYEDGTIKFGLISDISDIYYANGKDLLYFENDHKFEFRSYAPHETDGRFKEVLQEIVCHKTGTDPLTKPLTRNLLGFLTQDITDNNGAQAKSDYIEILHFAIGKEMDNIFTKKSGKSRNDLMVNFRKYKKFQNFIAKEFRMKGRGYRELAKYPIIISSNADENIKRLQVLLGSIKAGGVTKKEVTPEYTGILDELYNSRKINKETYKRFYWKLNSFRL